MAHVVLLARRRELVAHIARALPMAGYDATVLETGSLEKVRGVLGEADLIVAAAEPGEAAALYGALRSTAALSEAPVLLALEAEEVEEIAWANATDDFVLTPARPEEVVVRARRMLEATGSAMRGSALRVGDVTMDATRFDVRVGGNPVALTLQEFRLLHVLMRQVGEVLSRTALMKTAWGGAPKYEGSRTVDVHIRRLRSKIGASATTEIETVSGVGYRLKVNTDLTNA